MNQTKSNRARTARAIEALAGRLMLDCRIDWAGLYLGVNGDLKLAIYHNGYMSISDLTYIVHEKGGADLPYLLQVPGFSAKKVAPRVSLPKFW